MKPKILIVDDDAAFTQQLFWTLCDDYDVITASDLHSALRRARIYEPAISILNLHLPPASDSAEIGLSMIEYIKAHVPESRILLTAANGIETERACSEVGADGFLDKQFDVEQLLTTMRRMAPRSSMVV